MNIHRTVYPLLCGILVVGLCMGTGRRELTAQSFFKPERTISELKKKLDALANVEVEYELFNAKTGVSQKVLLRIQSFNVFRVDYENHGTFVINRGSMLFFDAKEGYESNISDLQSWFVKSTQGFWDSNREALEAILGHAPDRLQTMFQDDRVFPYISLKVGRGGLEEEKFGFSVLAGFSSDDSHYSWLEDFAQLQQSGQVQEMDQWLKARYGTSELWLYRDNGLLHKQVLFGEDGRTVEATLSCNYVKSDMLFDEGLFELKAPQGVSLKRFDAAQQSALVLDMVGLFMQEFGEELVARGWKPDAADDEKIQAVVGDWLGTIFDLRFTKTQKQERMAQWMDRFSAELDAAYQEAAGDTVQEKIQNAAVGAWEVKQRWLALLKEDRKLLEEEVEKRLSQRIRAVVVELPLRDNENREALRRVFSRALAAAFKRSFESDYLDLLRKRVDEVSLAKAEAYAAALAE